MDGIIGLEPNVTTALTIICTGVLIPVLTSLLKHPGISKTWKRLIPIGLAAVGAVVIVVLQAGGPFAEKLVTWLLLLATLVGIGQAIYSLMPGTWKSLENATSPASARDEVGGENR